MPYQSENFTVSMFVYLPFDNSPSAVDDLIDNLSAETINQALNGKMEREIVDFYFPKIQLNSEYLLKNVSHYNPYEFHIFLNIFFIVILGVARHGNQETI